MNIRSSTASNLPVQESSQELHLELVRHYTDVLRLFTDRLSPVPVVSEPNPVVPDPAPVVSGPSSEVPEPDRSSCWESAESLLACRDWHAEKIVHLWLQPTYVLGFYALIGVGVSLQGHRRIVNVTQCGPQDQSCMEATLDALSTRGLGSGMRVTLPGNVALQSAVSSVWGSRVSVQRCLNTVMEEALTGLDPDEAMQFRHRLQQAWQQWDASSAQTSLQQITNDLTKVNRSSGQVLDHALEATLTLQRTGLLLRSDRGLRVLNSLQTLLTRATRGLTDVPAHPRTMRLCAALLDLEPRLRRVRHAAYLSQLSTTLHPIR